jgi:hypothetical protein
MAQSQSSFTNIQEPSENAKTAVEFKSHGTSTSVPFTLFDGRPFVNLKLNGEGPFAFIFDTGGNAVISPKVAERLHLSAGNADTGTGMGEKPVTATETTVQVLEIGDLRLSNLVFRVISMDDAPSVFGRQPVDGIIGLPILERVVVKIDYERMRLELTAPSAYRPGNHVSSVHFERVRSVPLVDGTLDGVSGKFGVDTGARLSLLLYGPFVDQNDLRTKYHSEVSGVTGWGLGGPIRSQIARGKLFTMGNLQVRNPLVRLPLQTGGGLTTPDAAGLIGADILRQFDITLDYGRQSITFEKNRQYGKRTNFDRVGVWLGQDNTSFTVVDVISGSPADNAGIKAGDKIVAINGKLTEALSLLEIREEFRNDAVGKKMHLKLQSGAVVRDIVLTLRDLV